MQFGLILNTLVTSKKLVDYVPLPAARGRQPGPAQPRCVARQLPHTQTHTCASQQQHPIAHMRIMRIGRAWPFVIGLHFSDHRRPAAHSNAAGRPRRRLLLHFVTNDGEHLGHHRAKDQQREAAQCVRCEVDVSAAV